MRRWFVNSLSDFTSGSASASINNELIHKLLLEKLEIIRKNQKVGSRDCDGGIYVGVGGVSFAFWKLATSSLFQDKKIDLLETAQYYIEPALVHAGKNKNLPDTAAFLLGNPGVYCVSALIGNATGNYKLRDEMLKKYSDVAKLLIPLDFLSCGGDELLVGRCGYLSGVLALRKALNVQVIPDEIVQQIFSSMLTCGRDYARRHKSKSPLMYSYYNTEYLGAAHGLSGILQIMLSFPQCYLNDESAIKDLRSAVDYMLSLQQSNGNFPCAVDEINRRRSEDELVHWCHGAPGVVYLMAKAYLIWKDERYLQSCIKCGELVWERGLLTKGPGICHGVAGSGYVFLLLYRLTNEVMYLHRAAKFAEFLTTPEFKAGAQIPDCPYSLYEGLAGTVCYLNDVLVPNEAHFPLFDIF